MVPYGNIGTHISIMRTRSAAAKEAFAAATNKQDDVVAHGSSSTPPKEPSLLGFSIPMCMFFCSGIAMSLIGQLNTNKAPHMLLLMVDTLFQTLVLHRASLMPVHSSYHASNT